jgi:hypothetical protein
MPDEFIDFYLYSWERVICTCDQARYKRTSRARLGASEERGIATARFRDSTNTR